MFNSKVEIKDEKGEYLFTVYGFYTKEDRETQSSANFDIYDIIVEDEGNANITKIIEWVDKIEKIEEICLEELRK